MDITQEGYKVLILVLMEDTLRELGTYKTIAMSLGS